MTTSKITDCFPSTSKQTNPDNLSAVCVEKNNSEKTSTHPIFDGKYFKIKSMSDETKCICICMECKAELSANTNVTTNLYKHLKVSITITFNHLH